MHFVGFVVQQGKGCTKPIYFGVGNSPEVGVRKVVVDVCLSSKGEGDRSTLYATLDIEEGVKCVV